MNKYICFAFVVFAAIASASCSGAYNGGYNNLAYNSYGNPASSSAAAASSADAQNLGLGNYGALGLGNGYNAGYAPAASYAPKSYGAKYSLQNAYATELYPGQQNYKQYNSPATYSQVALPVIADAPLAKLYAPAQKSYGGYSSGY